jgi:lipopolysaccharide export system protein LptA
LGLALGRRIHSHISVRKERTGRYGAAGSEGRRGTGEQFVYTGATNEYVLTGSASAPPKMTDPARGTVCGEALIFHGRDDVSVSKAADGRR